MEELLLTSEVPTSIASGTLGSMLTNRVRLASTVKLKLTSSPGSCTSCLPFTMAARNFKSR